MKRKTTQVRTVKVAVAAMLSALGVVVLAIGSIIEVMDLTMVALASIFVFFAVIELGRPYPLLIYAVTSILSLLLLPNLFAAVLYLLFGGIYPILKQWLERRRPLISWLGKAVYFNAVLTAVVLLSLYLLHVEDTGFTVAYYLLGNITFFLYDVAMTKLITLYFFRLRSRLRIEKYFRNH